MHAAFDALGRMTEEVQQLWDPSRSTFDDQLRDDFRRGVDYRADGAVTQVRAPGGLVLDYGYNERGGLSYNFV